MAEPFLGSGIPAEPQRGPVSIPEICISRTHEIQYLIKEARNSLYSIAN